MRKLFSFIRNRSPRAVGLSLVLALAIIAMGFSSSASAAPDYFNVDKPSAVSQCDGGHWQTVNQWHGLRRYRRQVWVPNWQSLGFDSYRQCVRYVSTAAPTSKGQCNDDWRSLGFSSESDCRRYLRLHPGSGYDGQNADSDT